MLPLPPSCHSHSQSRNLLQIGSICHQTEVLAAAPVTAALAYPSLRWSGSAFTVYSGSSALSSDSSSPFFYYTLNGLTPTAD